MAIKYTRWPWDIQNFSIPKPTKIDIFGIYVNIPSGNPENCNALGKYSALTILKFQQGWISKWVSATHSKEKKCQKVLLFFSSPVCNCNWMSMSVAATTMGYCVNLPTKHFIYALAAWRIRLRYKNTRVQIPPGYKVFGGNTAVLLFIKLLNMHCLCVEKVK
jgi:hypothetical protein